ncbi:hypothetical protein BDV97DRAFT_401327 [Delphinella strobiligena]|nr:hypothetical protein BDV97DRAFT_401327 [Delphinella strobiligena]
MIGPPSDTDAVEGHERTSIYEDNTSLTRDISAWQSSLQGEDETSSQEAADRLVGLGQFEHESPPVRLPTLHIPRSSVRTSSVHPSDHHLLLSQHHQHRDQSSSAASDSNMRIINQPALDGHEDSDADDLRSHRSSEPYSPPFEPSLPSLVNSVVGQDLFEPDEISLSGDTASNADTVSDQFDGHDSDDSFENIKHEDIPTCLGDRPMSPFEAEELDQGLIMSDHTIVPPTTTIPQRLGLDDDSVVSLSSSQAQPAEATQSASTRPKYQIMGFTQADNPCMMPERPLRFLFVAADHMDEDHQLLIVAKIVSAITGKDIGTDVITEASESADKGVLHPCHQEYNILLSKKKSITFYIDHAVACSAEGRLMLKNGCELNPRGSLPDFAIFFHVAVDPFDRLQLHRGVFPHGHQGRQCAKALSQLDVATLEISAVRDQSPWLTSVVTSTTSTRHGNKALPFFHIRQTFYPRNDEAPSRVSSKPVPIPLDTFITELDNGELSRHLAWIRHPDLELVTSSQSEPRVAIRKAATHSTPILTLLTTLLLGSVMLANVYMYLGKSARLDAMSDMSLRQEALSMALNKSAINNVDATNIIHYPTSTGVSSGATTTGLAFPTTVAVHVARPDQLFVALPTPYRDSAAIGLLRNNRSIDDFNVTKLIEGVSVINLKPSEAYGQIHLDVRCTKNALVNQTVKVDLGNRLLQRVTYENAARDVQHGFQRDVEEVHTVAKAFRAKIFNSTHAALSVSAHRARALRNDIFHTASSAATLGLHGVTNTTSFVMKSAGNTLALARKKHNQVASAVGSVVSKAIPRKSDFNRARVNSLKLKSKLSRKPTVPVKQEVATGVLAPFKVLGRKAGRFAQDTYSDILAPGLSKVFSRPRQSTNEKLSKALSPSSMEVQEKALASHSGLKCQNKCSKNLNGNIRCHKCNGKSLSRDTKAKVTKVEAGKEAK